jgi:hypothetical protein
MNSKINALIVLLMSFGIAHADVKLTVAAGEVERSHTPVKAYLESVQEPPETGAAILQSADGGAPVPAQVGNLGGGKISVRWIEPELTAGKTKTYVLASAKPGTGPRFHFDDRDGMRQLGFGDQPVIAQMIKYDPADHANTFKPFDHVFVMHPTTSPATSPADGTVDTFWRFITKGPGGLYTHHRGIFFGFKTDHGDFWHCPDVSQRHEKFLTDQEFAGPLSARSVAVTNWIDKAGKAAFRDTRAMNAWRVSPDELVLDYDIKLETLTGKVEHIAGDAHHAGFHFRASNALTDPTGKDKKNGAAHYDRPATAKLIKDDVWEGCTWVNCTFDVFGRKYSVLHLDHPSNPRPTTYSTRGYGRFGAFFTSDVEPDKPLNVKYRLIIRDVTGATTRPAAELEKDYQDFIEPAEVKLAS